MRAALIAIAITISAAACQPKNETVDNTQLQLHDANASLARLIKIEDELRPYGVNVRTPLYGSYYISRKSTAELQFLQSKLTEYVAQGSNALQIAARLDVAYADRSGLADRVGNARMLLIEVKKNLGAAGDSSSRFWTNWQDCNSGHQQNLVFYGVHILYFDATVDGPTLMRLPHERRQEVATRARRYLYCEEILSQGRAQIFEGKDYKPGISKPYDVTGKAIDPLAPPSAERRNVKSLIEALKGE